MILDGFSVARSIEQQLSVKISALASPPGLVVVTVGEEEASRAYIRQKELSAKRVGIHFRCDHFSESQVTTQQLIDHIQQLNVDPNVHGIIVQLPLPPSIDASAVLFSLDPAKDVDGFHPLNAGKLFIGEPCFHPCTPQGVIDLLDAYTIPIRGQHVVIIGRSIVVGRPLAMLFLERDATVTICHRQTVDLANTTRLADIFVSATGQARLVTATMVKQGAVVIDAGWSRQDGKIAGDVCFEEVSKIASAITPVPGGVGPMTVATLMKNVVNAYTRQYTQ